MIRILEIINKEDKVVIRGTLDADNRTEYGYIIPESNLVPERIWNALIDNPKFEYTISKL